MASIFAWMAEGFDLPVLDWMEQNLHNLAMDWLMPRITVLGNAGIVWILMAAVLLCFPKTRKAGLTVAVALVIGLITCNMILKPLLTRIRPYDYQLLHFGREIPLLIPPPGDYSFPSGHTLASFEAAVAVTVYHRKWGIPALILAGLLAFSRLYLYVHYPSDVLFSLGMGTGIAFFAAWLVKKGGLRWNKQK